MIVLRHISLQRGGKMLFDDASFTVHSGENVGIVGANGTGKSTLFELLRGEVHQDAGDLELPPRLLTAHVAQEIPAVDTPAIDYVMDGDVELRQVEHALQTAEKTRSDDRLAELHAAYDAVDGYTARARAARLMAGLGFRFQELQQPLREFSGGWRVRLNLARALMCRSDLLLLDEPTNHLDLDAIIWLEQWLREYAGTLLLISHDRDFLDNVVDRVVQIERLTFNLYSGGFSAFERQRAERLRLQQAQYQKQQQQIVRLNRFIDRFRAKATKARQAQSRVKALERMEKVAAAHVDSPFRFELRTPEKLPNPLLTLDRVAVGYNDQAVLERIDLVVTPETRLGLLGPNGAGKSTLIKCLAGALAPLQGQITPGQGVVFGYFAQHQLEQLSPDWSPLQHFRKQDPDSPEQAQRDFLGGFGFSGDRALEPVAPLSGGEKARLALALLIWRRPNILLLDEPTNHLDLEMRHALTLALQAYQGALIVVSHDRHLLRTTTDAFALVSDGRVAPFEGDMDDYRSWLKAQQRFADAPETKHRVGGSAERRQRKRLEAQHRSELAVKRRPLENRIRDLESVIERLQAEKLETETMLAVPDLYDEVNKLRLKALLVRQGVVGRELEQAEEEWLGLQERLEAIEIGI